MKKKKKNELKTNRTYRASNIEESQIKALHKQSKLDMPLSRYKVMRMMTPIGE